MKFCLPFFLAVLALAACHPVEDTRPGQPVKHRQEAFSALLRAVEPVGIMLHDGKYSPEKFSSLKEAISSTGEAPWAFFGPDTDYPPSKSRPEVWSKPDVFEAERKHFLEALSRLQAAEGYGAVQAAYSEVRASCKSCHDNFRR